MKRRSTKELDPMRFGMAFGLVLALFMFLLGLAATYLDWGVNLVYLTGEVYLGFAPTLPGSIIGGFWGFLDGFLGGFLIAWIYNKLHI